MAIPASCGNGVHNLTHFFFSSQGPKLHSFGQKPPRQFIIVTCVSVPFHDRCRASNSLLRIDWKGLTCSVICGTLVSRCTCKKLAIVHIRKVGIFVRELGLAAVSCWLFPWRQTGCFALCEVLLMWELCLPNPTFWAAFIEKRETGTLHALRGIATTANSSKHIGGLNLSLSLCPKQYAYIFHAVIKSRFKPANFILKGKASVGP